jgi:hypothetical protein
MTDLSPVKPSERATAEDVAALAAATTGRVAAAGAPEARVAIVGGSGFTGAALAEQQGLR